MSILVRFASLKDAQSLLSIYKPYVEKTAITFEYEVPSLEEFENRISQIQSFYPYLVAEENGRIIGYAYASPFKDRAAYDWSVEVSVYLDHQSRGQGVGTILYEKLEIILEEMGILNTNACIAYAYDDTPYLTNASQAFHKKLGYQIVGHFHQSGYKFQHWFDMIWMEKLIGDHTSKPKPVKSVNDIKISLY
ncbi:hypothetical protein HMPREF9318_01349 [Streptococcus urinalis FB127-CNA-2]|uniref:Acetyltransferase, GNAT family n=1 Tax=Streptococcus urinalis 2285-97 TaxID=764291 RepID=G5KCS9_9STRE|nr:GNAT family N-acetyltransferase [Streptococcus urinalis]EHJ57237.1 acetyltransferase, GNAT family [Streptococcus urinalis 2285-97]EKS19273.1 hypothetical protein HMPREF9318_01349 [Streptococcus urinalis FB127-CNA-2]VEF31404.1 acetyltransferase (GNAT) family protein [Streptococcus urinalis]